jgi:GxxExxY protein
MNANRTIDERQDSSRVKVSVPDTARFPAPNQDGPHKDISEKIIGAAFAVSNTLGCGFLEKVYENALCIELEQMGLRVSRQVPMRVQCRNQTVGDFAADLIVENAVLVELKATLDHNAIYEAQTIIIPIMYHPR